MAWMEASAGVTTIIKTRAIEPPIKVAHCDSHNINITLTVRGRDVHHTSNYQSSAEQGGQPAIDSWMAFSHHNESKLFILRRNGILWFHCQFNYFMVVNSWPPWTGAVGRRRRRATLQCTTLSQNEIKQKCHVKSCENILGYGYINCDYPESCPTITTYLPTYHHPPTRSIYFS